MPRRAGGSPRFQAQPALRSLAVMARRTGGRPTPRLPCLASDQSMPAEGISPLPQPLGPAGPRADRRGVVQQPGPLLLPRQPLELPPPRVVGQEERLLAVQDRRVGAGGVIGALDLAGPQVELDAAQQGRVRVGVEVGVGQVRDLARMAVELDQVGALDLAEVGAGAALVDAEQRVEGLQGGAVDVQGIGQELADGRSAAGVVDGVGVAGPEQQVVGPPAAVGVATEERPDVPAEPDRQGRDRRPAAGPAEGQVAIRLQPRPLVVLTTTTWRPRLSRASSYGAVESRQNRWAWRRDWHGAQLLTDPPFDYHDYHRTIVAFHGTTAKIAADLVDGQPFRVSSNTDDWLGTACTSGSTPRNRPGGGPGSSSDIPASRRRRDDPPG